MAMDRVRIRIKFTEGLLGTSPADPEIYETYIGSNAPDAPTLREEIEFLGEEGVVEKGMTVFPKDAQGRPFIYDYQLKGFFKDACGMMARVKGSESSKLKAYKKIIDGLIFVEPRMVPLKLSGKLEHCQRPLRASGPQGERVALAMSEEIPAGSTAEFTMCFMDHKSHLAAVKEWLNYGALRGLGQWRNSGKGRFVWETARLES